MIAANRCQKVSSSQDGLGRCRAPRALLMMPAVGEHEAPAEDGDEGRYRPGQHQDQPVEGAPAQLLVEQQREAQADAVVQGDAQGRPDDRPDEVRPEAIVGRVAPQDVGVVVQADELVGGVDVVDADRAGRVEAVGVGEGEVDAVDQGVEHEDAEDDRHRGDHRVGVPVLLVAVLQALAQPGPRRAVTVAFAGGAVDGDCHVRHLLEVLRL
ncbi:hypothetical protein RKD46_006134 [Streptomyces pseudovenezuelae]